jgi:hypothetical protein
MADGVRSFRKIEVILPEGAEGDQGGDPREDAAAGLRYLTRRLVEGGFAAPHEFAGMAGEFGYGVEFENDTFEMHPFYWGECECGYDDRREQWERANRCAADCYGERLDAARREAGLRIFTRDESGDLVEVPGIERSYEETRALEAAIYEKLLAEFQLPEFGCAVHCTCGNRSEFIRFLDANPHDPRCGVVLPNFWFKPGGCGYNWYKWIGRDMEMTGKGGATWADIYDACVASIDAEGRVLD